MVGDQTVSHLMDHAVVIWSQYVNGCHLEVIQDGFVDGQGSQETGDLARLLHATQPVLVDPFFGRWFVQPSCWHVIGTLDTRQSLTGQSGAEEKHQLGGI